MNYCKDCIYREICLESSRGYWCRDYFSKEEYRDRCRKAAEDIEKLNSLRGKHEKHSSHRGIHSGH